MQKTFHFMAGIHRSGSTLLSAILNQHPEIYSSPQTELVSMLYELNDKIPTCQSYKAGLFHTGYQTSLSVVFGLPESFFIPV